MYFHRNNVAILGAGGHAKVIIDIIKDKLINLPCDLDKQYVNLYLYDDKKDMLGISINNVSIKGNIRDKKYGTPYLICAIGDNNIRRSIVNDIENSLNSSMTWWVNIIGKNCSIAKTGFIDIGTVIFNNVNIGPNVVIGRHSIINNHSNIDHDCTIGEFVHIAPGAILCGGVEIGNGTLIGAGATILPNIKIGKNLIIRAGSMIKEDILSQDDRIKYYKKYYPIDY